MTASIKKYILATATLSGTIIGAGIFSLPYIAVRTGFLLMSFYFLGLTGLVLLVHLFFSEVALKTPDFLRLPGYAKIYLGKWGKIIAVLTSILGSFGALLVYIIIGGGFLANLLSPIFGGNDFFYIFLYFLAGAICIFWGASAISKIEFGGLVLFFLSLVALLKGLPFFNINNLPFKISNLADFFLPYGPILFALWGASIIPEIEEMLGGDKKNIKKVVFWGTIIPAISYFIFAFLVVLITGFGTSKDAISGLKSIMGPGISAIIFFAGVLTTFTSFITIGLTLKKVLWYDIKIPKNLSWAIACFIPFLLYLLGFKDFIGVIGFIGGVALAAEGILILLMYKKIGKGKIKFLIYPLILFFVIGLIYEIIYFFKYY